MKAGFLLQDMEVGAFYDISVKLGTESIDHPGGTPYSRKLIWTISEGNICNLSELVMTAHTGTHIDAPRHFDPDGKSIDQYSVSDFVLPAHVIHIEDEDSIKAGHLEATDFQPGEALLFRTSNSMRGISRRGPLSMEYVSLSLAAAEFCVKKGAKLVGIDYVSIDRYGDRSCAVHRVLLENGILILEGIHLEDVPEGRYTLVCFPLNVAGAEASPTRAVLIC